ncbi:MAG: AAA family ATPase [Acidobacteriota bacterium]|nr:AAA family ATPase [Acidobacteriota bacterium]
MRIALSGTHRTGKSTLLEELARLLPDYALVEEPYHLLAEEGYVFSQPPSLEDFEAQLERSLEELEREEEKVLFDRCPLDFLAYLAVHEDANHFSLDRWLPQVRDAIENLDLVVLVPIEVPDRIALVSADDDGPDREAVDGELREMLLDDSFELETEVLEVTGTVEERARAVLGAIHGGAR